MQKIKIVADGSCIGNPGPGGWAALVVPEGKEEVMLSGLELATTNNRMEMMAVIKALSSLEAASQVLIIVDSRYVMDPFEKKWLAGWKRNGWKTAAKTPVKNQDLWELLDAEALRHKIDWLWVKGHSGHVENERVDAEANKRAVEAQRL